MPFGRRVPNGTLLGLAGRGRGQDFGVVGKDNLAAPRRPFAKPNLSVLAAIVFALLCNSQSFAQEPGRLGAVITDVTMAEAARLGATSGGGAYVVSVTTNGPAEAAGFLRRISF